MYSERNRSGLAKAFPGFGRGKNTRGWIFDDQLANASRYRIPYRYIKGYFTRDWMSGWGLARASP